MPVGLLGKKLGMTQVYDEKGTVVPVTVIEAGPCTVMQIRTPERDGYEGVQVGYGDKPRRLASRAERGHVAAISSKRQRQRQAAGVEPAAKPDCEPKRYIKEFRTDGESHGLEVGQTLTVAELEKVLRVDVIGTSKGHGTTGVMKRHNFQGQPAAHGAKKVHRLPGSIGSSADPSKVVKGMKMAGRHGNVRVTTRNLRVVRIDAENNLILVEGAVPGRNGGYVIVRQTNRLKRGKSGAK